jgi:aminoglycoside phosphotransferase (APT) family kinase protein
VVTSPIVDGQPGGAPRLQWDAEQPVPASLAAELIGRQFPRLRGTPVEPLATGWDNTVYLVGGQWVFRFPRRAIALPGIQREIAVLPLLAPHLPLPVPVPELVGNPAGGYPWPYWGARLVPGTELAEAGLPDSQRVRAGASVGAFLRALHDPGLVAVAGQAGLQLPDDPMRRAYPGVRAERARVILRRLAQSAAWEPDAAIERLFGAADRLGPPAGPAVIAHGDLHLRHLLIGEGGDASGVIDWGDLCLADPAADLSLAYCGFAGPARAALLAAYGPVDAERELRARVCAVSICVALAEYAISDGRAALLRETLAALGRVVSG